MSGPRSTNSPNSTTKPKPKPQPPFPSVTHLADSLATQSQLIDSLTAHISLYNSRSSSSTPNTNPNPHPRASILKWFSSLTVHQRQAHLTTVDHNFTQLLLQMLAKLHASGGHGRFIILPDIPSSRDLPGLCFKKSRGLLSRTAYSDESERFVYESVLLFGSREGEKIEECSCSVNSLDSLTMSEEFVEDVDRFVAVMDKVSNGAFLRGEESELGSHWVELEWLKVKGYYSIEAFVANRLEVAIRLAWMNCGNGKKRGVKLKEKVSAAGMAANVFWRKKGCVDWWQNLTGDTRRKVFCMALGKSAKALTCEILKEASMAYEDERRMFREGADQPFRRIYSESSHRTRLKLSADAEFGSTIMPTSLPGKCSSLTIVFNRLYALYDIITLILADQENNMSKVFFSTFSSVSTIADCILRKLRGLLMVVQLDCTKLELFGDGNLKPFPDKSKAKNGVGSRKKKGKNHNIQKLNSVPGAVMDVSSLNISHKKLEGALADIENTKSKEFTEMPDMTQGIHRMTLSSAVEMEHSQGLIVGKGRNATRKNRKGKNKNKGPSSSSSAAPRKSKESVSKEACSASRSDEAAKLDGLYDSSTIQDGNLIGDPAKEPVREDINYTHIQKDHVVSCSAGICSAGPNNLVENQNECLGIGTLNYEEGSNVKCCVLPATETCTLPGNEDIDFQSQKSVVISDLPSKGFTATDVKEEPVLVTGQEKKDSHGPGSTSPFACLSYEWPSLAPVYFPSINSHLPPATDRLHLDVGNNRHAHIRQPFVSTIHQARNSHIESGRNHMLSRPFPMSLEWPPVVTGACGLASSMTYNYESGFISRRQSAFQQSFAPQSMQFNAKSSDDEKKHTGDVIDFAEATNSREIMDDFESHWISEEEIEVHAVSGVDYSQYFGGGVMYWNPSDYPGTGFSRPPSLSSDDSWAWHEADMNRTVDDVVAFPSSYGTNGLTSPTATSFCPAFDSLVPGHQALGYVVSGNEVPGKIMHSSSNMADVAAEEDVSGSLTSLPGDVESKTMDSLPYPVLRPIIIPNMSREKSRSDFRRSHDHKSPCVPPTRREQPQIKRPPSPVVLCVRAPRPPPPSPASDSRKHRGFPIVRSGSSSPRHWGVKGWYNDVTTSEDARLRMDGSEVVWPSWRNKNLPTRSMAQPLPGALLQDHLIAISKLSLDQDHPDVSFPLQPPDSQNCPARKASLALMHNLLHDEIDLFFKQVISANMARKPFINWAVKRVTRSLQVLWPRSRTNVFGSNATGLSLPTSDVDLVVCLPPVRNLEPIKEAGILEGRNGIKETCLQHAARYLANQEWVKNDSLKTVENTAIPIIMLVVEVPSDMIMSATSNVQSPKEEPVHLSGEHDNHIQSDTVVSEDSASPKCYNSVKDVKSVRLDISFKSPSHTGLQTTELVKELTEQFPASTPLALVLKQFLADRSLDQSYSGGLSSYCLVILITRFLQHEHHLGRPINQNWGSLLMDFLYFFGNVFDPRLMRVSVQGSGVYIKRERGYSIDPIYIDDPLFPTNNVGRNCFRIHQCIKAFSDAYSILENELTSLPDEGDTDSGPPYRLLAKIIPSINLSQGI